ncbi:hypothetical protein L873DRAFT_1279880 [Choiromyces venosus 120613-1]|uniref:TPR-like protein n=1 Tax=Choiromyces venosus 120613-1 TaxID=1336337 RepID=A0A3N4KFQ6_9PEZI|nr:hypothetical protein L873DRAFT_1279880 [Choiromyces venosus 120613-1]
MFRHTLGSKEKVLGPDHPDTLTSVDSLAVVLRDLGRYDESETMFQRALESQEKVLGSDHPYTLISVNNLAFMLRDLGRYDESETMWRCALETRGSALGPEHYKVSKTLARLASLREKQKSSQAEVSYELAFKGSFNTLDGRHPTTWECIWRLKTYREKNSAIKRISFVQVSEVVNLINHRRSPSDCPTHFAGLRGCKGIGGMTLGK